MVSTKYSIQAAFCTLLLVCAATYGQVSESRALIRQDPRTAQYYVVVQLDTIIPPAASLTTFLRREKKNLRRSDQVMQCPPDSEAFANRSRAVAESHRTGVPLSPEELNRKTCEGHSDLDPPNARFRYYFWLGGPPQPGQGYAVSFDFTDSAQVNHADDLKVTSDFTAEILDTQINCEGGTVIHFAPIAVPTGTPSSDNAYLSARAGQIFHQMKTSNQVIVEVEPRVENVQLNPATYTVTRLSYLPPTAAAASADGDFFLCVNTDEKLPVGEYHARLTFTNDPPIELQKPLKATLKTPLPLSAEKADEIAEAAKLGARTLGTNFDLQLLLGSSVENVEKEDKSVVRERQNEGSFSLILAPRIGDRGDKPPQLKTWRTFTTPFFFDAKLSTGKITDKTLSTNRFILGYEREYRYYSSSVINKRNIYRVFLRGLNASDRDLKRPEIKGQIEFRPLFDALHSPLREEFLPTVIFPDKGKKSRVKDAFGFFIQPFVGAELGRTYRDKRTPFKGEEVSRNVRRLFFGTDIKLFMTRFATLTILDTFYVRGEAPDDRGHNHFNAELDFKLARDSAQSLFISFERGNEPPFATADVNAFKIGYRIRSNFPRGGAR